MNEEKDTYILGISCFYHDSAAVLLKNGEIIAAAQEERFTRKKQDDNFPTKAVEYCLSYAGIQVEDLHSIAYYEKPFVKFERLLTTYIKTWPRSYISFLKAMKVWLKQKLWIPSIIRKELGYKGDVFYVEHHLSHAASSFFASPYEKAAVLTVDGVGEWATATYGIGDGNSLKISKEIHFPHSLGLLYSAFTYYLGFKVNSGEYKVMGLAPYGEPKYVEQVRKLIDVKEDGSFHLNMKYFGYEYGLRMTNKKFDKLFGEPPRKPETKLTQREFDIARSLQYVLEEILLKMVEHIHKETGEEKLCLAGGVALNCVANGRILRESSFKELYIQPASGDAGGALGAALFTYNTALKKKNNYDMKDVYLGPDFKGSEIAELLDSNKIKYEKHGEETLFETVANFIDDQKVIGWFQGRMEYGPRALGNRSIVADARNKENWQRVNLKIKFRESFRPFAPSVIEEDISEYFDLDVPTPFMLLVAQVKKDNIPAVTHKDNSARIQSVSKEENYRYHKLISAFKEKTGTSVIINTSFNVRGEPIVCTPLDALKCFLRTDMDILVMGDYVVNKNDIDKEALKDSIDYEQTFEKD
ncbi:carbamoyltransferase [Patescibacteria group bacterium]